MSQIMIGDVVIFAIPWTFVTAGESGLVDALQRIESMDWINCAARATGPKLTIQ